MATFPVALRFYTAKGRQKLAILLRQPNGDVEVKMSVTAYPMGREELRRGGVPA